MSVHITCYSACTYTKYSPTHSNNTTSTTHVHIMCVYVHASVHITCYSACTLTKHSLTHTNNTTSTTHLPSASKICFQQNRESTHNKTHTMSQFLFNITCHSHACTYIICIQWLYCDVANDVYCVFTPSPIQPITVNTR